MEKLKKKVVKMKINGKHQVFIIKGETINGYKYLGFYNKKIKEDLKDEKQDK